jgi:hypothetical protein
MQFDFKITTWERVEASSDEKGQEILKGIKDGTITSAEAIFEIDPNAQCQKLADTDEQLTVEENGGQTTIEVLDKYNGGETIYQNGK